jgi:NAD(P)-dependent dehydrogenase (short-subunit alcohol dehydrogenase family)
MNELPVAVVTGANSGFGRLIADTLARNGHRVYATMRDIDGRNAAAARDILALAAREALPLEPLELDVNDEASVERSIAAISGQAGRIDVVVNNAGFALMGLAETVTLAQAQQQFDTNFFGVLRVNRAVLPVMKRRRSGLLVHISSGAGRLVFPGLGLYCASKFALEALAEVYRYELAGLGIDSVIIEPGAYPTPIMAKLNRGADIGRAADYGPMADVPDQMHKSIAASTADPQEIADLVLRIASTPAGARQLRHRVGAANNAVQRINALTDDIKAEALESSGLGRLTRIKRG